MRLFLYGTLADPKGFGYCADRPVRAAPVPAVLHGYRRVCLRGARYPTLRRARGAMVVGVMMRVTADMLVRLQNYESVRYRQMKVRLQTPAGQQRAICFFGDAPTRVAWHDTGDHRVIQIRSRAC